MSLTTEIMSTITKEVVNGMPATLHGEEEDAFRAKITDEVEEAKKEGMIIEIPPEWPDISEESETEEE